jgi:hypothetical protein
VRTLSPLAALIVAGAAVWLAHDGGVRVASSVDEATRAVLAALVLFGACGLAPARLLLPDALRPSELLWVVPIGACVASLVLTALGYVGVPFHVSLGLVLAGGAISSALTLRRAGRRAWPGLTNIGWPAYVAVLLTAIALVPYFRGGYASVIGIGSDAHLAVGTAQFLQHNHPTSTNPDEPVDRVPLVWRSKPPIYYALGGVASLSGLEVFEAIAPLAAFMLALAGIGIFLIASNLLGAGWAAATLAMALAGLDQMVLHTGMHPYYNQTWGYFAFPFAIVLSWHVARSPSRGGVVLLVVFLAICGFAYPLALPLPLLALGFAAWRERKARGLPMPSLRALARRVVPRRRSLLWVVPLLLVLAVPLAGIMEKVVTAMGVVVDPRQTLRNWGGDLTDFFPLYQFFSIGWRPVGWVALPVLLGFAVLALRGRPATIRWSLGAIGLFGLAAAVYFRSRDFGYYFHFKVLAYVAPLIVAAAAVGMARVRILGPVLLVAFLISAGQAARTEIDETPYQLSAEAIELRDWAKTLPRDASVRLDVEPPTQLWPAYMLSRQPLCSPFPLTNTQYPHVRKSLRADYVLVGKLRRHRPPEAVGPALFENKLYALYRLSPDIPGRENCSRRMVQTVTKIAGD